VRITVPTRYFGGNRIAMTGRAAELTTDYVEAVTNSGSYAALAPGGAPGRDGGGDPGSGDGSHAVDRLTYRCSTPGERTRGLSKLRWHDRADRVASGLMIISERPRLDQDHLADCP
jgi:hypothetical protein